MRDKLKPLPNLVVFSIDQEVLRGHPDLMMCANGKFIAWELKKDAQSVASPLQKYYLDLICKSGGYGEVVHLGNFESELEYLRKICEG